MSQRKGAAQPQLQLQSAEPVSKVEEENNQRQQDEIEALRAIYSEQEVVVYSDEEKKTGCMRSLAVRLRPDKQESKASHDSDVVLEILLHLPASYPASGAPEVEVSYVRKMTTAAAAAFQSQPALGFGSSSGSGSGSGLDRGRSSASGSSPSSSSSSSASSPTSFSSQYMFVASLSSQEQSQLRAALADIFAEHAGSELLFQCVEWVREKIPKAPNGAGAEAGDGADDEEDENDAALSVTSQERRKQRQGAGGAGAGAGADADDDDAQCPTILSSGTTSERRSVFQAHWARVRSLADVQRVLRRLYANPNIARATHNIYAYRFTERRPVPRGKPGEMEDVLRSDHEDDGETMAGKRLALLLDLSSAADSMVVVTRWYGGVHLGPLRFHIISDMARKMLVVAGVIGSKAG